MRISSCCKVESGEFRGVDPALAGRVVLSVINGLSRWFRPDGRLTIAQVIDQYLDIILGGIARDGER